MANLSPNQLPPCGPALVRPISELKSELDRRRAERPTGASNDDAKESVEEQQTGGEESPPTNDELDAETLYLAITTTDSTVVYYKLSKGIKKPADIPDE